ncbi:IclR family transcriptional regulator [Halalkalibacter krulwichiae]|uniref:IclR family transcriptional regulator n=1 Tax=Halalkalibacter krulwichiae TaxID=199441 RepID=UPI000824407D|nr:IclR family transcriptional regulator [Halalkalibacter krulwichiae]
MRDLKISEVNSLNKAIDILEILSKEKEWVTINEIIAITKYPRPTVYRLLYTMEKRGLIRYDSASAKYNFGFKFLEYSNALLASQDILQESEFTLIEMYKKLKQTVLLATVENDSLVYIFKRERAAEGIMYTSVVGQKRDLLYGALGRVLLAYLPKEQQEKFLNDPLPQWTPHTISDKASLLQDLEKIRSEKLCVEINEATIGLGGIASPIFGLNGEIIAVLGVICPTSNLQEESLEETKSMVKETAHTISTKMGYQSN